MEQSITLDTLEGVVKELAYNVLALELALPQNAVVGVDGFLTTPDLLDELHQLLPKAASTADMVWQELFVHRTPLSEPCRRVLTLFNKLGFRDEVRGRDLGAIRNTVAALSKGEWEKRVYSLAKLSGAVHAVPVGQAPSLLPAGQPYALHWTLGEPAPVANHVTVIGQPPHHLRVHVPAEMSAALYTSLQEALALCQQYSCPLWVVTTPGGCVPEFPDDKTRIWLTAAVPQPNFTMVGGATYPSGSYDWTRKMLEQRGTNFVAHTSMGLQTPEQVASAWYHARSVVARTLTEKYRCLIYAGWSLAPSDIQHDLQQLLAKNVAEE